MEGTTASLETSVAAGTVPLMAITSFEHPEQVGDRVRTGLVECWQDVSNAGGAVGFPFPPVERDEVVEALDALLERLDPKTCRLFVDGAAAAGTRRVRGWCVLTRRASPLVAHWGQLRRLQTRPELQGQGIASNLLAEVRRVGRDELGLEQLHLAVRGGMGLERFYSRLGWREVGRWPRALRVAPGDDRDDVLMVLEPL